MRFEVLGNADAEGFERKYEEIFGMPAPLAENRCVVLAVDEETRVAGFLVGQNVVHMEPLWIDEHHRGRLLLTGLIQKLMDVQHHVPVMYTTTKSASVSKILSAFARGWRGTKVEKLEDELWRLSRHG